MSSEEPRSRAGVSLAKGPTGLLGLIGVLYGLSALLFGSHGFALHVPQGAVHGGHWIGLEVNGWSDLLFIAAGVALLLGAPLHWGAKSMSLIVGLVMLAAAIVAVIRGNGVFGIFAASHLTEVVWAAAGIVLVVFSLLPRVGARTGDRERDSQSRDTPSPATGARGGMAAGERAPRAGAGRRLVRRREEDPGASDERPRPTEPASPQERPSSAGAQTTHDNLTE